MLFKRSKPKILTTGSLKRRNIFLVVTIIVLAVLCGAAWFATTILQAKNQIITSNDGNGSIFFKKSAADVKPADLAGDSDGRVNILLLGIRGFDNCNASDSPCLTDTIQVLSLDTKNHKAAMLSIPRDLYYKYSANSFGRINEMYKRGEAQQKSKGADSAKQNISSLLDVPIHYYAMVDLQAFKQLVDTLGGITVTVTQALEDCNYPNENIDKKALGRNYVAKSCKSMDGDYIHVLFNIGTEQMNGTQALVYARSRHSSSDFDRSKRQQTIMQAIKQKALSVGVVTNPFKISEIMSILGGHVRTDMQITDLKALVNEVNKLDGNQIISGVIDTSANGPLIGQNIGGADVLVPKDGDYSYQAVKEIAHGIFTNPYLAREQATIEIKNATGKTSTGTTVSNFLKTYGYVITKVSTASQTEKYTELIDYTGGKKPFTQSFLEKRYNVKAIKATPNTDTTTNFVLLLGTDYGQGTKN